MEIVNDFIFTDYQRAVTVDCFHGTFEEFKEWAKEYCWGIVGQSDPKLMKRPDCEAIQK